MHPNLRACIANAVARVVNRSGNSVVYDHSQGKPIQVTGSASASFFSLYDHDRGAQVTGTTANLYDHGTASYASLELAGPEFSGFDQASGKRYRGRIDGKSVVIHDEATGQLHNYSV